MHSGHIPCAYLCIILKVMNNIRGGTTQDQNQNCFFPKFYCTFNTEYRISNISIKNLTTCTYTLGYEDNKLHNVCTCMQFISVPVGTTLLYIH